MRTVVVYNRITVDDQRTAVVGSQGKRIDAIFRNVDESLDDKADISLLPSAGMETSVTFVAAFPGGFVYVLHICCP